MAKQAAVYLTEIEMKNCQPSANNINNLKQLTNHIKNNLERLYKRHRESQRTLQITNQKFQSVVGLGISVGRS